jgi:hypothetical protein
LTKCKATAGGKDGLASASGLVGETVQSLGAIALGPLASVAYGQAGGSGGVFEGLTVVEQQEQAGASRQAVFEVGGAEPVFEFVKMSRRQLGGERGSAAAHRNRLQQRIQNLDGREPAR